MNDYINTLIAAIFGTLGFGMIFRVKPSSLIICSIGGLLTWGVVIVFEIFGFGLFTTNAFASIFAIIYSSIVARKIKTPSTVLLTTCIIPLVPGGSLYYTMQSLIMKNFSDFYYYGTNTILIAVGIAGGILIGSIIFSAANKPIPKSKKALKEILKMKSNKHFMHLENEPFELIVSGNKTVELRLYDEKRKQINIGDVIEFESCFKCDNQNDVILKKRISVKVVGINVYPTFKELYEDISLKDMGYKEDEIQNASYKDMEKYYSYSKQVENSVVAFRISLI